MAKIKNKKSSLADNYVKIRKQSMKKTLTPFEVHINKKKQNVLGKKSKTDQGLPGIARAKAITKRKDTLLVEYKIKDKDNIFLDHRIGEKNFSMTKENKAIARFAAERIKDHKKKNIFNLNDEEVLTHRGQSLIDIEKYDNPRSDEEDSSDENKTGKLDKIFVEDVHFGGGVLSKPNFEMSRKDLIDKLITESKKRKVERQKVREQTIDLTEKLNSEWHDLLPLMSSFNKTMDNVEEKLKTDDYDIALRKLKYEARGNPTDKLSLEAVIAKEESLAFKKLEENRLVRMTDCLDEVEFQKKHRSADDLDDFVIEKIEDNPSDNENINNNNDHKKRNSEEISFIDEIDQDNNESKEESEEELKEQSEEESEEELKEQSEEESGEESANNLSDLKVSDSSSDEEIVNIKNKNTKEAQTSEKIVHQNSEISIKNNVNVIDNSNIVINKEDRHEILEKARQELPCTFKVPSTYKELRILIQDYNPDYQSVIIERIIKSNHWKLAGENKEKLLNLFFLLLQYLNDCAFVNTLKELIEFFQVFDRLCPHLYDLTHANPETTKNFLNLTLKNKHNEFENNIKSYPKLDTLILFKLVSILYPTSDFRHPIVTPCLVFMSQILLRCKIKEKCDISKGLFLCTLILEYTILNKRWSPSVINFLRGIIFISLPKPFSKLIKVLPPFKAADENSNLLVLEESQTNLEVDPITIKMQIEDFSTEEINDDYRLRTFITAINLLFEFKEQCKKLDAAYLIFEPILISLKCGSLKRYPKKVKEKVQTLINDIEKLKNKKLECLVYNKKRPKALKMYEPRIEIVHDGKKHKPMSKEKAEREKLLHKLKKEKKSAIREVRKDNAFLSKIKIKQQIANDIERKQKVKELYGNAAIQQSEFKKFKKK